MKAKNLQKNAENIKFFDIICTFLIFILIAIILSNPKQFTTGTIEGIKLFFFSVLPGLLPFMLLTKLLTDLGVIIKVCSKLDKFSYKVFGTNGLGLYAFIMSILSGYPIGAKIISDLYTKNLITEQEAKRMSIFCTTSGPIFVIGAVGTMMFGNYKIGLIMYLAHILSSLFLGIIVQLFSKKSKEVYKKNCNFDVIKQKNLINLCINDTISSLFIVCAYITIFYLIGEILTAINFFTLLTKIFSPVFSFLKIDNDYVLGIFYGILEVTRGVKTLSAFSTNISIIISTAILSFSGISIIFQSMAFLKNAKIKMYEFIFYKFIHAILSIVFCILLIQFIL